MEIKQSWTLKQSQYISDIAHEMDLSSGVNLIIADVGTGKSHYFSKQTKTFFIAPLISIVSSIDGLDVSTWNSKVSEVLANPNKEAYKDTVLVIDECHGLYTDYGYKSSVINDLIRIIPLFKSVVLMSGTIDHKNLQSIAVDRIYRVMKPQLAEKNITKYVTESRYTKELLQRKILETKGKRKAIALVNDIDLCNTIAKAYGDKALVVSSKVKNEEHIQNFFDSKMMTTDEHDYDLIIGTDSIREGLSIEDELESVDVFIYGHRDPDAIEQFTNRFRNVEYSKNVHVIVPESNTYEMEDFNHTSYCLDARTLCSALQSVYDTSTNEDFKESLLTQYRQDMKGSNVFFNKTTKAFEVSLIGIDYAASQHRERQCMYDNVRFEMRMSEYDFRVQQVQNVDGDEERREAMKEKLRESKAVAKAEREELLKDLIQDYTTGDYRHTGKEDYDGVKESVDKLIRVGLTHEQIPYVIQNVIQNKNFIKDRVWPDFNYVETDSSIRNFILEFIAIECPEDYLERIDLVVLSNLVVKKVLKEFFNNDKNLMCRNELWSKLVRVSGYDIMVRDKKYRDVLNRYITLDKPKKVRPTAEQRRNCFWMREVEYISPVKFTNLSGLDIEKKKQTVCEVEIRSAIELKKKLQSIKELTMI